MIKLVTSEEKTLRENTDIEDLPDALKKQLSKGFVEGRAGARKIREAIDNVLSEEPMTMDDILLAVWRHSGDVLERDKARTACRELVASGEVEKVDRNHYKLRSNATNDE